MDRAFAKLYGSGSATQATPMGSYGAWLSRDLISMGVIFTLPPIVAKSIAQTTGNEKQAYYAAQFGLPLVLQTVTTPLHLLGYEIYNNPNGTVADRIKFLQKDYFKNVGLRMVR